MAAYIEGGPGSDEEAAFYDQRNATNDAFAEWIKDPANQAIYDKQVADRWSDIQNHRNGYESSDGWFDNLMGGVLDTTMELAPYALAVMAVVATAGAGASALGAATTAGETVAAGGAAAGAAGMDAAVTSAVASAAAASPVAAAAVSSIPTVVITGSAAGAGMTGAELLTAIGATAAGAGAVASLPGSSYQSANYGGPDGEPDVPVSDGVDPNIPRVDVTGTRPVGGTNPDIFNTGGIGAVVPGALPTSTLPDMSDIGGVNIPESDLPPLVPPVLNPMDPGSIDMPAPDNSWVPTDWPNLPNLPGGSGTPAPGSSQSSGGINPLLIGGALALFMSGLKDAPDNPALNSSISKLNGQGDAQMADWNNWMYPQLKGALADNKAATDAYLNASNTNAGKLEGMGDAQRQYAQELYNRNRDVYTPLADKIIADANQFDKAGYGERQAGLAVGDLQSAYAAQRQQQAQQLAQYGISPTSGRALAMSNAGAINNAANTASAATRARMAAEDLWGTKQMNAMNTAGVLNANANAYAGLNAGAGSLYTNANNVRGQGVNATSQYFTNADSLAKTTANTYTSANNAYSSAGNLALGKSKIDNDRYMAEQQGRGTVLGAGLQALGGNKGIGSAVGNTVGSITNGVNDVINTGKSIYDWGSKLFS